MFSLFIVALAAIDLLHDHQVHQQESKEAARTRAWLLERDLAGTLGRIDLALQSTVLYLEGEARLGGANPSGLQVYLATQATLVPEVHYFLILDKAGKVAHSSAPTPPGPVDQSDRDWYLRHRDRADLGLVVAGPLLGRISNQWVLVFARRLADANGRFAGVVLASLPVSRFNSAFYRIASAPGSAVGLWTSDHRLVARYPALRGGDDGQVGQVSAAVREAIGDRWEGALLAQASLDGQERHFAFQRMVDYPFIVIMGVATTSWAKLMAGTGWHTVLTALLTILTICAAGAMLYRRRVRQDSIEAALRASEERLALALEATSDGLWDWDVATDQVAFSPACPRMLGYEPGNFARRGREWVDYVHPADRGILKDGMSVLKGDASFELEFRMRARDGTYHWVLTRGRVAARGADGRAARVIGTQGDITRRKQLENELREAANEVQAIFNAAPGGIALLRDRCVVRCNRRFEEIFGLAPGEGAGLPVRSLYPSEESYASAGADLYSRLGKGSIVRLEWELVRKSGARFPVRIQGQLLNASAPEEGALFMIDDITEEHAAREVVRKAKDAAEAAARAKADFLANMSHEIRTPMNAILGLAHLLLRTELTPRQRDYLVKMQDSGRHLLGIIDDILDLSKSEAGKLTLESVEFDLDKVASQVAANLAEKAAAKGIELVVDFAADVPRRLVGDSLRLSQVLLNLGSNAVKFTEHGEIVLRARLGKREGEEAELRFEVRDTGIGLTAEARGRLFQSFQQADTSTTRKYGGTGLGLAICRRLVEMMRGEIGVDSEPGRGSTFWFTIRVGVAAGSAGRLLPRPDLRGTRALVVDDLEIARAVMRDMLGGMSFLVDEAASGEEAVGRIRRAAAAGMPYALVFLDWRMAGMDGVATAEAIRRLALEPAPHVIMVTAFGRDEVTRAARDAGVEGFLAKPVTASTLFDAAIQVLSGDRTQAGASAGPPPGTDAAPLPAELRGARVLLVEDNVLNQEVARELLVGAGLQVDVAENGAVALERLRTGRFDLVFMDMLMPVMDGVAATEAIRRTEALRDLPVIAMTADVMPADRERALAAGMNDFVAKPIDPEVLWAALRRWLKPAPVQEPAVEPPRSVSPQVVPTVPGLDTAVGLRHSGGNPATYLSLLRLFVANEHDVAERIAAALGAGDGATARRHAHTLKGVAATIGADALQRAARQVETLLAQDAPAAEREAALAELARANALVTADLRHALSSLALPAAPGAAPDVPALCARLAKLLSEADLGATHLYTENERVFEGIFPARARALRRAMEAFDFEAASRELAAACAERKIPLGNAEAGTAR